MLRVAASAKGIQQTMFFFVLLLGVGGCIVEKEREKKHSGHIAYGPFFTVIITVKISSNTIEILAYTSGHEAVGVTPSRIQR